MPYAIGNMTRRYNKADLKKDALTSRQRLMRIGRYVVYNTGEDPVFIQKGETLGQCSLIYQDTLGDYLNKMGYMAREARADQDKWRDLKTQSKKETLSRPSDHSQTLSTD